MNIFSKTFVQKNNVEIYKIILLKKYLVISHKKRQYV